MKVFSNIMLAIAMLCPAALLHAEKLPEFLQIRKNGEMVFDTSLNAAIQGYDPSWKPFSQRNIVPDASYPQSSPDNFSLNGSFYGFKLTQSVKAAGSDRVSYRAALAAIDKAIPCKLLFLSINLMFDEGVSVRVDNKDITMNTSVSRKNVFDGRVKEVVIDSKNGVLAIRGDFRAIVAGNFTDHAGKNYYQLRLLPPVKLPDEIEKWELSLEFQGDFSSFKFNSLPLDISTACNRSFIDEKTGDGKGGWTDQGPEMDLRALKSGEQNFFNVRMNILDPTVNDGKSCIVLTERQSASVTPPKIKAEAKYLYLLHASAWTPSFPDKVGNISVTYANGEKDDLPVVANRDCANWYKPIECKNAAIAWKAELPSAHIGLFLSAFPLKSTPARIEFKCDKGMWMIAAASLTDKRARILTDKNAFIVKAGSSWLPVEFKGDTAPGSPLDFSWSLDAPAGKYGHITANQEGHLVFEKAPDKRIRLFGTNLVGSANFLSREMADDFVAKAARIGYNSIRLHHFEQGLLDLKAPDSLTIDPEKLDQLHYLFARLKEKGFYICIDLYASRKLKAGDNITEFDDTGDYSMKNLVVISPAAMENWKSFARKVLTAKNPYTKLTMAEDPALYSLNLVNENTLTKTWNHQRSGQKAAMIIERKFDAHFAENKFEESQRNGRFIEFLNHLQSKCIDEQMAFLKNELKLKALITDLNWHNEYSLVGLRSKLDLVDNHQYWDHPSFPGVRWRVPFVFGNRSSIGLQAQNPRALMPTRVFGKPFTVTEFNFCVPNIHRVEAPTVFGAYSAMQDWDGIYRFAWSHGNPAMNKQFKRPLHVFDSVNNIQSQLADRVIHMLFVRGDVKAATPAVAFEFKPDMLRDIRGNTTSGAFPDTFTRLGLWCRIGSLTADKNIPGVIKVNPLAEGWEQALPADARAQMESLRDKGVIESSTKEVFLDKNRQSMLVTTPKSEVFTGKNNASGLVMSVSNPSCYQTLALMSLDDKPLRESRKMLLIQLTDLSNNLLAFDDNTRRVLRDWGTSEHMLERGGAELSLALPADMRVIPLRLDGSPEEDKTLKTQYENGRLSLRVATDLIPGGTMAYLLTTK